MDEVIYHLTTDFILHSSEKIKVIIHKSTRDITNLKELEQIESLKNNMKPVYWLRMKCSDDRINFKEDLSHLA